MLLHKSTQSFTRPILGGYFLKFICFFDRGECANGPTRSECRDSFAIFFPNGRKFTVRLGQALARTLHRSATTDVRIFLLEKEKSRNSKNCFCFFGPSVEIRTRGLLNPIQARYQTSPHPDQCLRLTTASIYYHTLSENASTFLKIFKKFFTRLRRT